MSLDFVAAPVDLPDLDHVPAEAILAYAIGRFSPHIAVACSMQDAVMVDLAVRHDPSIEVFFLDTGFHFSETLDTAQRLRARSDLNLVILRPEPGSAIYHHDGLDAGCAARKVAPMDRYLATKWVSVRPVPSTRPSPPTSTSSSACWPPTRPASWRRSASGSSGSATASTVSARAAPTRWCG